MAAEYCNNGNFVEASYLLSKHAELTELNDDSLPCTGADSVFDENPGRIIMETEDISSRESY